MEVTYFKTLQDVSQPFYVDIGKAIERIRNGKSRELVEKIRQEDSKAGRNLLKKGLPAILFSGKFSERKDDAMVQHSGVICIDFDGFDDEWEMLDYRHQLQTDPYTYSVFTSPSGDGLKVLVKIPADKVNHRNYFESLQDHYNSPKFDKSCKNESRICYESYDAEIYVNENSETFTTLKNIDYEQYEYKKAKPYIKLEDESEIIKRLTSWWERHHGMVQGQKNNNLYILAAAFNDFGFPMSEAEQLCLRYDEGGKETEIRGVVRSVYNNKQDVHGSKFFEDDRKMDSIKSMVKNNVPKSDIAKVLSSVPKELIEEIVDYEEEHQQMNEFWTKDSKGKINHVNHLFKEYLQHKGYFKFYPEGSDNFIFVKFHDNVMFDANEDNIKTITLDELYELEDMSVFNYFSEKTKLFKSDHLTMLKQIEPKSLQDDKYTSYLYYLNCAVKVTKNNIETIPYEELDGFVWNAQKIQRNFDITDYEGCVFQRFIGNISSNNKQRCDSMESTIGYLMHGYKPPEYSPAVILNDEVISDNPEGGTGKGIFCKSLGYMRNQVTIDGKSFNPSGSFPYQLVQASTQLLLFDDVNRNMPFEKLFSVITEGMTLEKKNKDAIHIPFEKSPKIIITTNYAIRGAGNSFERRKWELELAQYYNKNFTPEDEFGHVLFKAWSKEEWLRFDNYMISNLQKWLDKGFVESDFKNLDTRKFVAETSMDFYEWATDKDNKMMRPGYQSSMQDIYNQFTQDNPDFGSRGKYAIPMVRFSKWIDAYGDYAFGQRPEHSRTGNIKMIEFKRKEVEQGKIF